MENKLTIEHFGRRVGNNLKLEILDYKNDYVGKQYDEMVGLHQWDKNGNFWSVLTVGGSKPELNRVKPILRNLSSLSTEITHKGKTFIPLLELSKIAYPRANKDYVLKENYIDMGVNYSFHYFKKDFSFSCKQGFNGKKWNYECFVNNQFQLFNKLIEWNFHLDEPDGTFIYAEDLEINTYEQTIN
jgi:hypothetical protein